MEKQLENRERLPNMGNNLTFINIRPGGNDTALILGIPESQQERRQINNAILSVYPNIEQTGFITQDQQQPELMMAGGEFCGNATRSAAWKILEGQPGNISIKVSGVAEKLRAGVTKKGEAYAQMPIYSDPSAILPDLSRPGNYIIAMEGITHYIDRDFEKISGLSHDEIKRKAREEMRLKGIDQNPAAGIIYTKQEGDSYSILPIVYVKDIDTLFLETACGSGTTALGLVLALERRDSITNVPIIQPSGIQIEVSIDYNGKTFGYAQIKGPIEKLQQGTLETTKNKSYAIEEIEGPRQLDDALRNRGLREAYRDAFGRPPYNESFTDEEIDLMFGDYVRDGSVFVAIDQGQVISFAATQPLRSVPELGEILVGCDGIDADSWYIPELGTKQAYESNGIGKKVMQKALAAVTADTITLRTNANNTRAQGLYLSLGFEFIQSLSQDITQERTDGTKDTDTRIFMQLIRKNMTSKYGGTIIYEK